MRTKRPRFSFQVAEDQEKYSVFLWDGKKKAFTRDICSTFGHLPTHSNIAWRIASCLEACQNIPNESLDYGYIRLLQELLDEIEYYLQIPTPETKRILVRKIKTLRRMRDGAPWVLGEAMF